MNGHSKKSHVNNNDAKSQAKCTEQNSKKIANGQIDQMKNNSSNFTSRKNLTNNKLNSICTKLEQINGSDAMKYLDTKHVTNILPKPFVGKFFR